MSVRLFALSASLLTLACHRSEAATSAWSTVVDTLPTGAVRITHTPPAVEGPPATLQEELRIGSGEGGPDAFARIKGIQVLSDDRVAVLDAMAKEIRIFDATGQPAGVFGGAGEGPGEFSDPNGLMQDGTGRLWIPDYPNQRMSVVDPEEGFVESFPVRLLSFGFIWDGCMSQDGRILIPSITVEPPRRRVLRTYDLTMTELDSLPLPEPPPSDPKNPPGAFYWEAPGGRGMGFMQVPFYPQGASVLDPRGGVWSRESGEFGYRVKLWQPGGDTLVVIETMRPPVAIAAADRDTAIDRVREQLQRFGAADQDWSKVPTVRPSVLSILLSDEGHLWVETPNPAGGTSYDRYDRDGTYLGSVASDLRMADRLYGLRPVVRGDRLWAVVLDELDVQYVVRYRIVPGAATPAGGP